MSGNDKRRCPECEDADPACGTCAADPRPASMLREVDFDPCICSDTTVSVQCVVHGVRPAGRAWTAGTRRGQRRGAVGRAVAR